MRTVPRTTIAGRVKAADKSLVWQPSVAGHRSANLEARRELRQKMLAAAWYAAASRSAVTAKAIDKSQSGESTPPLAAVTAPSGIDWDCVAIAETGGNWSMRGSSYSTALGIMNQAVRENAIPEVAARVFAGTASRAEQIAIAERIVARFGFNAWAPSTVAKCS